MSWSSGFAIATLFIAALHGTAGLLADLFNKERSLTHGARFVERAIPQRIFTLWVTATRIKIPSLLRALLNQISTTIGLRTFHSQRDRLGRLAFRIGGASQKLSETSRLYHHRT